MRINLNQEELTDEVRVVSTVVKETGIKYYGTRFYLKSPESLHHSDNDDDRSAVTFWFGDHNFCEAFAKANSRLLESPVDTLFNKEMEKATDA